MPSSMLAMIQEAQPFPVHQTALDLVFNAGLVAKVVMLILLIFSIFSWGIMIDKWRIIRRVRSESDRFLALSRQRASVRDLLQASRQYPNSPFAEVFKEAYWLFNKEGNSSGGGNADLVRETKARTNHTSSDVSRVLDAVASREVMKLERFLPFLATTGSVSPFFGLFGTVWGVMTAFLAIGLTGSADLSVVAPGIAEALITTVAGLGAAIPAVMGYNFFVNKLQRLSAELEIYIANLTEAFMKKETHEVR